MEVSINEREPELELNLQYTIQCIVYIFYLLCQISMQHKTSFNTSHTYFVCNLIGMHDQVWTLKISQSILLFIQNISPILTG